MRVARQWRKFVAEPRIWILSKWHQLRNLITISLCNFKPKAGLLLPAEFGSTIGAAVSLEGVLKFWSISDTWLGTCQRWSDLASLTL